MTYCENDTSFTTMWTQGGFSHCFIDTVTTSVLLGFILVAGTIQICLYRKYASPVLKKNRPTSCLYYIQQTLNMLMFMWAGLYLMLHDTSIGYDIVFGYQLYFGLASMLIWSYSIGMVHMERTKQLPSIPTRGHGLILLIFWSLAFIRENMAFISWESPLWWWGLNNTSERTEFGLWVCRYVTTLGLFVLGFMAPGKSRTYSHLPDPEEGAAPQEEKTTWSNLIVKLKLMLPYVWPKGSPWLQFIVLFCVALLVLGRVVNIYVPLYSKYIVDSLTPVTSGGKVVAGLTFRWDLIVIYLAFKVLQGGGGGTSGLLNNLRSFLWIRVQQYTTRRIQVRLFTHLHGLSLRWHLSRKTGEVLRVVDRGTNSINNLLSYVLFQIFPTIADIIIAIVYFVTVFNYIFGVVVLISMLLYFAATVFVTEWRTKYRREMNLRDNETNSKAVDSLLNFETVKYYGGANFEINRYNDAILGYQKAEWSSTASLNLLNMLQTFVINLGLLGGSLLCAYAVVYSINDLHLTVGDYVQYGTYMAQLYAPLGFLGTYYRMIQQAFIDMENMFDLLDQDQEIKDVENAKDLFIANGGIEFNNVSFHYEPEKQILKEVSFTVPPGETYALVGHSGSGKSTIIRLLFRFYDINSGSIKIDGQDISLVKQESLRQCIGVVPQDTVLFNADIRYNIRYGRVTAKDDEVDEAARSADIHDRILSFPRGYETMVGERGLKLSGGEKQRVAIARTLLKAPSIVLLDEATSALDTQTERNIQASLARVCENRTTIIVAHRLSTIIHANQILVMQEGVIIERGRHEELLVRGGHYADMWHQQLTKRDDVEVEIAQVESTKDK